MKSHTLNSLKSHHPTLTFVYLDASAILIFPPHKLSPHSAPCIFLRYPSNHRGYQCFNLATHQIIISRHVTFDVHSFPYRSMTPNEPPSYSFLDEYIDQSPIYRELLNSSPPSLSTDGLTDTVTTPPPSPIVGSPYTPCLLTHFSHLLNLTLPNPHSSYGY